MTIHSAWLSLTAQSRQDTRLAMSTAMAPAANLTSRSGLIPDGGLNLQSVAAMQCQITPGRAYVQGVLTQGAYPVAVDAAVPLTVPDGDPQYGRIDLVVLRVRDDQFDGTGQTAATVELVTGTPAATPVAPAVPAASLGLWQISVPTKTSAGTGGVAWSTATTDLRVYTSGLGGIVPAGTTTWTPPAAGQYSDLSGLLKRWNGSAWTAVYDPTTLGNVPVVTSTTRPASPTAGRQVFETDTGRISLWSGSVWETVYDPNLTLTFGPWTTITPGTGYSQVSGNPLRVRLCPGGIVQMAGGMVMNTVANGGATQSFPSWATPATNKTFVPSVSSGITSYLVTAVVNSGSINYLSIYVGSPGPAANSTVMFDGITYAVGT